MWKDILYWALLIIQLILAILIFYFTGKLSLIMLTTMIGNKPWRTPYIPTRNRRIRDAFEMLEVKDSDCVLDLGSGDGKFLIYSARRSAASFTGIEIGIILVFLSKLKSALIPKKGSINIICGDYMNTNLSSYNKIFMFSMPSQIKFMLPKLEKDLKPKTRLLSVMFPVESKRLKLLKKGGKKKYPLFLYEKV